MPPTERPKPGNARDGVSDFPHRRHVKVAWALAQRYDVREAFARACARQRLRRRRLADARAAHPLDHVRDFSVLASDQHELATRFAESERPQGEAQFHGVPHHLTEFGPIIDSAAACLGCHVHSLHKCGDHHIVVGEVADAGVSEQKPLVPHDGAYH